MLEDYIILIVISYGLAIGLSLLIRWLLSKLIDRSSQRINADPTNFVFLKNSISLILLSLATFWIFHKIPYFHSLGTALFAGAGVLAALVGFASQKAFSNIIGGIFILIFKPFRVGDTIEILNKSKGTVEEITLRHTIIKDYENRRVVVPNNSISDDTIINSSLTDEKIKKFIDFSIGYDSDLNQAKALILECLLAHPLYTDPEALGLSPTVVRTMAWEDSSIRLRAYVWAKNNDDAFVLSCEMRENVKAAFEKNGIEIPYPHQVEISKNRH